MAVLAWSIVLHYLDDFFAILSLYDDPVIYRKEFDRVYDDLGLSVNHTKDIIGTIADFLGIKFDSVLM